MAIRISRRAKYLVVLALITVLLYGSIGNGQINALNHQKAASSVPKEKESYKEDYAEENFSDPGLSDGSREKVYDISPKESPPKVAKPEKSAPVVLPEAHQDSSSSSELYGVENDAIPPADALASELAALQDENNDAPRENLLPTVDAPPLGDQTKFQLGRKEKYPVDPARLIKLPSNANTGIPKIQTADPSLTETKLEKQVRLERQMEVRDVFKRDWAAYKTYAWMHDELKPMTNGSYDPFGGWGATLVDSLDTMIIMDLEEEYREASEAVAKIDFTYTSSRGIPIFETTIRYLGGLLAAYDLGVAKGKKDSVLLSQAKTLGQVLYGAFDTPNRMPMLKFDYRQQATSEKILRAPTSGCMAEVGSLSVEFTRLAQLSDGDDRHKYFDAIQRITDELEESMSNMTLPGLWPLLLDLSGCERGTLDRSSSTGSSQSQISTSPNTPMAKQVPSQGIEKMQKATDELLDVLEDHKAAAKKVSGTAVKRQDVTADVTPISGTSTSARTDIDKETCKAQGIRPSGQLHTYSQGGQADSTYEYFTKEYLLLGGGPAAEQYKRLYETTIEATKKWLMFKPLVPGDLGAHDLLMAGDVLVRPKKEPQFVPKMQHLTCFIGGMFAMGAKVFSRPDDLILAGKLTDGCVWAYDYVPTGVAPEVFHVHECKDENCKWQDFVDENARAAAAASAAVLNADTLADAPEWAALDAMDRQASVVTPLTKRTERERLSAGPASVTSLTATNFMASQQEKARTPNPAPEHTNNDALFWIDERYILRPEAIESVWYMYRITGDKTWQDKGWKMWKATEALTRTPIAHSAVTGIMNAKFVQKANSLESFWFAETLKYYYLLFSDFETVSLDEYVLNTEAHPMSMSRT